METEISNKINALQTLTFNCQENKINPKMFEALMIDSILNDEKVQE